MKGETGSRRYSGAAAGLFGRAGIGIQAGDATTLEKLGDSPAARQGALQVDAWG